MKFAASQALYNLAREDVPDSVLRAYGVEKLKFGPDYIIPKPLDPRVLLWEAPAVAKAAMETGVARKHIDLDEYTRQLSMRLNKGLQVRSYIINKAKSSPCKVVYGEGEEVSIIRAAAAVQEERISFPILLGGKELNAHRVPDL